MTFYRCRFSPTSKIGRLFAACFYPFVSLVLLFAQVLIIVDILHHTPVPMEIVILLLTSICIILLFAFFLKISCTCYRMENRQIALDSDGFTIRDRIDRKVPWKDVCCIGALMYASNASKQHYQQVVCIFLKETDDRELRRLRDSYLYGAFNQDRLILIDRDAIFVKNISNLSGLPVVDLCSEQMRL